MPSYICYIPQRLGHSVVLDATVDLVFTAAGHLAMTPSDQTKPLLMKKYDVVLRHLQKAILDDDRSREVDILAAVSLLSSYEVRSRSPATDVLANLPSVLTQPQSLPG